jgi:hypothetical protein
MALTIGSNVISLAYPLENEPFLEQFFSATFDGVTAGAVSASKALIADSNGNITGLGKPATIIGAGATKTLRAANNNNIIAFDTAGGSVVTLPAATGSGYTFDFYVKTLATSNSHIVYTATANGVGGTQDLFVGLIPGVRTDSTNAYLSLSGSGFAQIN